LFHDLVAEGAWKERSERLLHRLVTHIIDHDYQLIDEDGLPTRWGIWNPDSLNGPGWWYERGLNSLQILAFLKTAGRITGDQKFYRVSRLLEQKFHYAENIRQVKRFGPYENSFSDDILTYLPYYCLASYARKDSLFPTVANSLALSWSAEREEHIPLWDLIAGIVLQKACGVATIVQQLQQVPMDQVSWTMTNSHRWDLPRDPVNGRGDVAQSVRTLPLAECGITKWNANPHQYDTGNGGYLEDDGAYFLLPYWMGRYHGVFREVGGGRTENGDGKPHPVGAHQR
ncbi:MAG: hypothetical protein LWW85_06835, partial [Marinilabiliales bacterium]|nr:hypothetical protein [Marinilabiliales bacterium]